MPRLLPRNGAERSKRMPGFRYVDGSGIRSLRVLRVAPRLPSWGFGRNDIGYRTHGKGPVRANSNDCASTRIRERGMLHCRSEHMAT
jgi:hypothetical protein